MIHNKASGRGLIRYSYILEARGEVLVDSHHPEPLFHTALTIPDNVNTHEERLCQETKAGIESNQKTTSFSF